MPETPYRTGGRYVRDPDTGKATRESGTRPAPPPKPVAAPEPAKPEAAKPAIETRSDTRKAK